MHNTFKGTYMGELISVFVALGIVKLYSRKQKPTGKVKYRYKVDRNNILLEFLPNKVAQDII